MGQYYRALTKTGNGKLNAFDRSVIVNGEPEYTPAKLTEHSWFFNQFVNALCEQIYNAPKPTHVIWMGDYATQFECYWEQDFNGLTKRKIRDYHKFVWDHQSPKSVEGTDFTLSGKYLINHSKNEYINGSTYYENNVMEKLPNGYGWCLHPLPILTCIGNGLGGGDYTYHTDDSTIDYIGSWAWDELEISDTAPDSYTELHLIFKEKGW